MRRRFSLPVLIAGAIFVAAAIGVWACGDPGEEPSWALTKPDYDPGGGAAMLLPSNDTRINLYLLLADRRGTSIRDAAAKPEGVPLALFPWKVMAQQALPRSEGGDDYVEGSRCQSNQGGAADFVAAVRANGFIPENEKKLLIAARQGLDATVKRKDQYLPEVECRFAPGSRAQLTPIRSPAGRDFASYLDAAGAFYSGDFNRAVDRFKALSTASDPWVREASEYMTGRALLSLALDRSLDEYGSLKDADKRDRTSARAAEAAFKAYVSRFPTGRYGGSARGLVRRAYWLVGDQAALAGEYGRQLHAAAPDGAPSFVALVNEIDNKLSLPTNQPHAIRDPLLVAVVDLHRMRGEQRPDPNYRNGCCGPPITKAEVEAQRALFGSDSELFDYVRAAEAYFVRHQPREVLQLLPDAARQQRFTYVQFSRQMLRGLALQDVGDRNARAFWLSLFPAATRPYQREALELALAMHDEKAGRLDLVFAPDSRVRHPIMRELLIEHVAGPDILRRLATRTDTPKVEREIALYMLLSKELRRGFYRDFLTDLRLLPADGADNGYFFGATLYDPVWNDQQNRPPLASFGRAARLGNFGCPPLATTVSQLADNSRAIRPRLCLAEFFRNNGFDDFNEWGRRFDEPVEGGGLAGTRQLFPRGTPYARLEVYKAIINDPAATADHRALALNRAVRCYGPSGGNSCGGIEVPLSQRRAWYNRLKAAYPQSHWAQELKFYW